MDSEKMEDWLFNLETDLQPFMEVLLKSIVYEVSEVFRNRMSDSEDSIQNKLRSISQILVRRAVIKITQCVQDSFGTEITQMKKENETLKVRLQFWEKESGAGGEQGQTDNGCMPPSEVTGEIKEEMVTKLELSAAQPVLAGKSGLPVLPSFYGQAVVAEPVLHQGSEATVERTPPEQRHSDKELGSNRMQETELTPAEEKNKLGEKHTESRQSVEDVDSVQMMKPEPEIQTGRSGHSEEGWACCRAGQTKTSCDNLAFP
nr:PREDICTED: uncharacterized protein LOC102697594 isoform X2 [Lepisosteus oculatus]